MFARLFSKSKLKTILLAALLLTLSPIAANSQVCGDVDGSKIVNPTCLIECLVRGCPLPARPKLT